MMQKMVATAFSCIILICRDFVQKGNGDES